MTNLAKQKILRLETMAKFPYLISIHHYANDGTETIYRYANSESDIEYEGNVYSAGFFQINPPDKEQSSVTNGTLSLSCVDQFWITKIRETQRRAKVDFVASISYSDDLSIDYIEPIEEYTYELSVANSNDNQITFTMIFDEKRNVMIPTVRITPMIAPAIE